MFDSGETGKVYSDRPCSCRTGPRGQRGRFLREHSGDEAGWDSFTVAPYG